MKPSEQIDRAFISGIMVGAGFHNMSAVFLYVAMAGFVLCQIVVFTRWRRR